MKTKLITLLILTIFVNTYAQFGSQQIITNNAVGASMVSAADLNGDGDMDVLSVDDDKVAWYENIGGGTFGPQQIIVEDGWVRSLDLADVDLDGDIDILVCEGNIYWIENIDGLGEFGPQHYLGISAVGGQFTDLDGDGDMDVLVTVNYRDLSNEVIWHENLGGGTFGAGHIIASFYCDCGVGESLSADIDGDGDMDLIWRGGWHENLGGGNFGPWQWFVGVESLFIYYTEDLDGDGDIDLIARNLNNQNNEWYRNDGQGVFSFASSIGNSHFDSTYTSDLDNDGDMDVLSASYDDNKIAWYENTDGLGVFGSEQIITNNAIGASSVYAEDLDGDGDMDVLSASSGDDKIAWYENLHPLSVSENTLADFSVYPIPTTGMLIIESKTAIAEIVIYNQLGQLVVSNKAQNTIDLSSVSSGIYFIKIKDENGNIGTQKVVKN